MKNLAIFFKELNATYFLERVSYYKIYVKTFYVSIFLKNYLLHFYF